MSVSSSPIMARPGFNAFQPASGTPGLPSNTAPMGTIPPAQPVPGAPQPTSPVVQPAPAGLPATAHTQAPMTSPQAPAPAGQKPPLGWKQELLMNTGFAYVGALVVKTAMQLFKKESLKGVLPWTLLYGSAIAAAFNLPALLEKLSKKPTP